MAISILEQCKAPLVRTNFLSTEERASYEGILPRLMVTLKEFLDISKDVATMIVGLKLGDKMLQLTTSMSFKALSNVHCKHILQQARLIHEGMIKAIKNKSTEEFAKAVDMARAFPKVMQNPDLVFVGATNLHPRAVETYGKKVIAESGFMTEKQRIAATAKELGLKFLSKAQEKALLAAHYVKGKGLGKYTKEEIAEKKKILEKDFSQEQVRKILDRGLAGFSEFGRRSKEIQEPKEIIDLKNDPEELLRKLKELRNDPMRLNHEKIMKEINQSIEKITKIEFFQHQKKPEVSLNTIKEKYSEYLISGISDLLQEPLNPKSLSKMEEEIQKLDSELKNKDLGYKIQCNAEDVIREAKKEIKKYNDNKQEKKMKEQQKKNAKVVKYYEEKWKKNSDIFWLIKHEYSDIRYLLRNKSEKNVSEGEEKPNTELQKIDEEIDQVIDSVDDKLVERAKYLKKVLSKDPYNKSLVEELIELYKKFEDRQIKFTSLLEKKAYAKDIFGPNKEQMKIIKNNATHTKELHENILKLQKMLTDLNSTYLKKDNMSSINVKNSEYSNIANKLATVQKKITHFTENPHLDSSEKLAVLRTEETLLKKKLSEIKQEIANIENNR